LYSEKCAVSVKSYKKKRKEGMKERTESTARTRKEGKERERKADGLKEPRSMNLPQVDEDGSCRDSGSGGEN